MSDIPETKRQWKPRTPEQSARANELQAKRRAADPERVREASRRYRQQHPDRIKAINQRSRERLGPEYWREHHQARKATVILRYGGVCECCGEAEMTFLSIDHIEGGGSVERKAIGASGLIRKLLASEERLPGYRVLCMNCNTATTWGRTCPHQLVK